MTHTLTTRSCYCRDCKKISRHYGVEFGGELVTALTLHCKKCGETATVEPMVLCAECGHEMRESAALWSEEDGTYYCSDCRTACAECGQAIDPNYAVECEDGSLICAGCEMGERIRLASAF